MSDIQGWFDGRLPDDWFEGSAEVRADREEIVVIGTLAEPDTDDTEAARKAGQAGRIKRFRETTRRERMQIADEAEYRFGRKVAWGATCGEVHQTFTSLAAPVMTRLRQPERRVLDTLVEAGVARSRSEGLVWCVRLVGQHEDDWLDRLRNALVEVESVRDAGPAA